MALGLQNYSKMRTVFLKSALLVGFWLFLAPRAEAQKPDCERFWSHLFRAQADEELLGQGDSALVRNGLEIAAGGVCGPVCVWNHLFLWNRFLKIQTKEDPIALIQAMVKEHGRDNRWGMNTEELSKSLLRLSREHLPGEFEVEVVDAAERETPISGIRHLQRDPSLGDLRGDYPVIALLEARSGRDVMGYHWVLLQPQGSNGTVFALSDPERPNQMQTVDFGIRSSFGQPTMFAGRSTPYDNSVFDYVPVTLVRLKPVPKSSAP